MKEDDVTFIDAEENYGTRDHQISFREIVLRHLSKISEICTAEFKEGYWQKRPMSIGGGVYMSEVYIEDKRDAYINAVDFFHDILLPSFDEDMIKFDDEQEKELDKTLEKYKQDRKASTEWMDHKLLAKRKLFQQLNLLLNRTGYFEEKVIIE